MGQPWTWQRSTAATLVTLVAASVAATAVEAQERDARTGVSVLSVATPRSPVGALLAVDSASTRDHVTWSTPPSAVESNGGDQAANAFLGAVIGAAVGILACTAISNAINEGTGFSTCTTKGYTIFGGGGAALGLIVGIAAS